MSKTPVSMLQEYMAQNNRPQPEYAIVKQTVGTHLPSFTFRVTCGAVSAHGVASNKKDAKHSAAQEILKLIIPPSKADLKMLDSTFIKRPVQNDSRSSPKAVISSNENIFVNTVGMLNERCSINGIVPPRYEDVGSSGPAHMKMFTVRCIVRSLKEEATASTKKQAKHDAAKKMLTSLDIDDKLNFDRLSLTIQEPKRFKEKKFVGEFYRKLRLGTDNTSKIGADAYGKYLKKALSSQTCQNIVDELGKITTNSNEEKLRKIAKLLDSTVDITTLVRVKNRFAVSCCLDCKPCIVDIGIGATEREAKERAIEKMLQSIHEYLY